MKTVQFFKEHRKLFWWLLILLAVCITVIPLFLYKQDISSLRHLGYIGYFTANYFGYGLYLLPFLVTHLNPIALIIVGAFGSTIDEFFVWCLGKAAKHIEQKSILHKRVEKLLLQHGVLVVFFLGILPTPGIVVNTVAFFCGHYDIPFPKYFLAGLSGRLISRTMWTYGFLYMSRQVNLF